MAGKEPLKKRGPKPRADSAERATQVIFRVGDLYREFNARLTNGSRAQIARRDLRRYWTLANHQLRASTFDPKDIERLGREVMRDDTVLGVEIATALTSFIDSYAQDARATSIVGFSVADAVALADLYSRSSSPTHAAELFAEIRG